MNSQNEDEVDNLGEHVTRCVSRARERKCTVALMDYMGGINESADAVINEVDTLDWLASFTGDSVRTPDPPCRNSPEEVVPRTVYRRTRLRQAVPAEWSTVEFQHHCDSREYISEYRKRYAASAQYDNCSQCSVCYQYSLTTARRELKKHGLIGVKPGVQEQREYLTGEHRPIVRIETSQQRGRATPKIPNYTNSSKNNAPKLTYKYHRSAWQPDFEPSQQQKEHELESTLTSNSVGIASPSTRSDSPPTKSDSLRTRSDSPRIKSDSPRIRSDSPRIRSDSPRIMSDTPLIGSDSPRTKSDSPRTDACKEKRNAIKLQFAKPKPYKAIDRMSKLQFAKPKPYKAIDRMSYELSGRRRQLQFTPQRFNGGIPNSLRCGSVSATKYQFKQAMISQTQVSQDERVFKSPSKLASNCYQDLVSFRNTFRKYYLRTSTLGMSHDINAAKRKQRIANLCKAQMSRVFSGVRSNSEMTSKYDSMKIIDGDASDGSARQTSVTETSQDICDDTSKSAINIPITALQTRISTHTHSSPTHLQRMQCSPHVNKTAAFPKLGSFSQGDASAVSIPMSINQCEMSYA